MPNPTKAELQEQIAARDERIAELETALDVSQQQLDDATAPAGGDLTPLAFHVSGVEWNGTQKKLVRCACSGDWADKWLAIAGRQMFSLTGQPMPARPFLQVSKSLQAKVAWDFDAGLAFLLKG